MSELSCNVAGVMYKSIPEEDENSCAGCCAAFGQKLCTELKACEGIIWIKGETEMTKEQQKEIKPKTININGYEVPEPLREAPAEKSEYYYPNIAFLGVSLDNYDADGCYDNHRLKHGLMHLTAKAAQLHLEALLSFTSEK